MVRHDFRHEQRNFVRRVELAGLLACVCCKVADQIFVDKAENIIILLAVHGNVFDEIDQVANGLCPRTGAFTQFGQAGLQRSKDAVKHLFVVRVDQSTECLQCYRHIIGLEVTAFTDPCGKQIFIGDKIADILPNGIQRFDIVFGQIRQIFVCPVVLFQPFNFLVRQKFIKHEAQNVILVLVGFDFRAHLVGRFPDFRCELLLVHAIPPSGLQ